MIYFICHNSYKIVSRMVRTASRRAGDCINEKDPP
nr:MAG TPA: hypothetical protein [Caudoviricetes sp.]